MFFVQINYTLDYFVSTSFLVLRILFLFSNLEPRQSNLTLVSRVFLSFIILSAPLTRGGDGCTLVSLLVSASLNSIRTNITSVQLIIYSGNTQVELSLKYMMYSNEHLSGTNLNLTTVSLQQQSTKPTYYLLQGDFTDTYQLTSAGPV